KSSTNGRGTVYVVTGSAGELIAGEFDSDTSSRMRAIRQHILPILELNDVDLVLSAHSQAYERSYLSAGHYQDSHQLTDSMLVDTRSGNATTDGPYGKSSTNGRGTVYVVTGSAGELIAGEFDHPIMASADSSLGSAVIQIVGETLDFRFLAADSTVRDQFQIVKGEAPTVSLTAPTNGSVLSAPQALTLEAQANDSDGSISQVDFLVDGLSIGADNAAPYEFNWTPPADGVYKLQALATDDLGLQTVSETVLLYIGTDFSLCLPIASGGNDVEEAASGEMDLRSPRLELIDSNGSQQVGLRFTETTIPAGASITSAYIQFTADTVDTDPTLLFFEVEGAYPSVAFGYQNQNLSTRTFQTGIVSWTVPAWNLAGEAGLDQQSPDLRAQIQQFIDQPGYQADHPITFRISGSGLRRARSFDAKSGEEPVLCVSYTLPQTCFPIADGSAIKLWHKADEEVYEDNGTDLAETGDGVALWSNFAQGGSDAAQTISGKRPLYSEALPEGIFNGSGGLLFGSNRSLSLADDWQENGFYAFIVQRSSSSVTPEAILASTESPDRPVLQVFKDNDEYFARLGTASQNVQIKIGQDELSGNEYHILQIGHSNDVFTVAFDGGSNFDEPFIPPASSTGFIQQILLGEDPNDDMADFQGEIAEIILLDRFPTGVEKG
ncbi:MAG: Ig-like domain-containing protein, partial [Bacteroidota bacterium]